MLLAAEAGGLSSAVANLEHVSDRNSHGGMRVHLRGVPDSSTVRHAITPGLIKILISSYSLDVENKSELIATHLPGDNC